MKNKNHIDKDTLIQVTHQGYGIEIADLEFLLRGFGGDCYRAENQAGDSYFLKLHDPVNNQMTAASSRAFYLPLMQQLHAQNILPNIPHPLPTFDNKLSMSIHTGELVITNFIDGDLVGFGELSEPILSRLAELVGVLHGCRNQLKFEHPFIEKFKIVFEQDLLDSFDTLAALNASTSPGQQLLREIILPQQTSLVTHLEKLKKLQDYALNASAQGSMKPMVICHTDLHGGNLMMDKEKNLHILDWENAMIAPPEHDLFFFAGEPNFWEIFWPRYTHHYKNAQIDWELLRFYFYRRGLEDIADFILRILRRVNSPERDQQEIQWMQECIAGLEQIEDTVAKLENRLDV